MKLIDKDGHDALDSSNGNPIMQTHGLEECLKAGAYPLKVILESEDDIYALIQSVNEYIQSKEKRK